MSTFFVNGLSHATDQDLNLLVYLRDELRLTSAKDGCAEGACGACMVLVDGKATRACLLTTARLEGKRVTTVEGLSPREQETYAWAFASAGAVQCGFCIPGMVMSAKGLLDVNPDPTREEVKKAIHGDLCRCTGYVKIVEAVLLAARTLREGGPLPSHIPGPAAVGDRMPRPDARAKVLGTGEYVNDMAVPGMLHGAVLRAPKPRVLIKAIDTTEARRAPGVVQVLTAEDVPGERFQGHVVPDWPALIAIGEETRYVGDALALVAAGTLAQARAALALIRVDFDVLEPLVTPRAALAEDAPRLHPGGNLQARTELQRGDVETAIAEAAHVAHHVFFTAPTEHAYLEPESALAVPELNGTLTVYTGTQSIYDDHHGIVGVLGVPKDRVKVVSKLVGGGFGGKEDLSVQHHAALLAWYAKRPVKLTLTRQESIRVHPKRHAMEMDYTVACDGQGRITAMKARLLADSGAYASLGGPVLERACTHAGGPYRIANMSVLGQAIYTNNPPGGAFRGFGVTQSCFAMECCLNDLAAQVGISPWEIRFRNAVASGDVLPNGQVAGPDTAILETLLAVKDVFESRPDAGIACCLKNAGIGVGLSDVGRVRIRVAQGKALVYTSAACIGQGLAAVLVQIVGETAGLAWDGIEVVRPDTSTTPDGGTTTASRQTVFNGEAARLAALDLKKDLASLPLSALEGREYYREFSYVTDPFGSRKPNPVSHIAYSYATQVVLLDEQGRIEKVVAAHDLGKVVNPINTEGQIEGGVVMGLGYALTEDYPLKDGEPTAKLGTLGLFRAGQIPRIESIMVCGKPGDVACGAKGVGEIVSIPTAPAVACAYFRRDGVFRTRL
ncbi:MAG TPA: selenium-dependent xanthine dehydrogenase, partial [Holophaga sp.]|nr:selenium-dependent xanthine dehydrogenase [Holophaga sp.]